MPLRLSRGDDGTTQVAVYSAAQDGRDGEWIVQPRTHPDQPASAIPYHTGRLVVPKVLRLRLMLNTGAVFGIGKNQQMLFAIVSVVAVGVIGFVFVRSPAGARWLHACLGLILAGALGNLYDRMRYNAVRDMFELFPDVDLPFGLSWPGGARGLYPWIFNIADVALVVGVGVMLVLMWSADRKARSVEKNASDTPGRTVQKARR